MSDPRHALGQAAEERVAAWLTVEGWRILYRRHRSASGGEVDLIGIDPGGTLVAVEVRARRSDRAGAAVASLDPRRIGRLRRTLASVAAADRLPVSGLRIDLVTVEPAGEAGGRWRLRRLAGIGAW